MGRLNVSSRVPERFSSVHNLIVRAGIISVKMLACSLKNEINSGSEAEGEGGDTEENEGSEGTQETRII